MTEPARTLLHEWHCARDAKMVEFAGWEMPLHYEIGILQEHLATRKFGGLFDVSHMGRFYVTGAGSVPFLQHVLSNNAESLQPYGPHAQYTLIADERGGVIDDAYLYRVDHDEYLLIVNAGNRPADWDHLHHHATDFADVQLEDRTVATAMFACQGPLAGRIVESLIEGGCLPDPIRNRTSTAVLAGADVLIARTGYTGEPVGFELVLDAGRAAAVWSALHEAGQKSGMLAAGLGARDTLRLEAGLPLHGHELGLDLDDNPIPAFASPLAPIAVSFSPRKGDFIGREALALQFEQAQKLLMGRGEQTEVLPYQVRPLALVGRGVARRGDEVVIGEHRIGAVTSGTMAPYWEFAGEGAGMTITDESTRRCIALACVDPTLPPEQYVEVVVRGKRIAGRVVRWHGRSEAPPYFHAIPVEWHKPDPEPVVGDGTTRAAELVRKAFDNHEWRQRQCINLIPSEMTPSPLVRALQVADPVGRYAEHKELVAAFDQEVYYYQGTEFIRWVEQRLQAEIREYLGCSLVEARPISGQMANLAFFSALVDFRNTVDRKRESERIRMVMNNHLGKGGHLSAQPMGALRDCVAKDPVTERFAVVDFPVCEENPYRIDLDATGELIDRLDPELFILGKSLVLHPEPVAEIRALVASRQPQPLIMYDMAHVLGLVGPHFQEPFAEGADIVTASTHKTFFGTQRGIIGAEIEENTAEYELWEAILRRSFPGMVSNHHLGTLVGLLLAAIEMNTFKDEYQRQVIANAKAFARALREAGLDVQGDPSVDFTETHQVIVKVGYAAGCEVAQRLEDSNIICNYQALPGDDGFTASSGLRLGVAEMTRFGMTEDDFRQLAALMADVINGGADVAAQIAAMRFGFQTMQY
ncbi:MAG TPA: glycine cleavage system protein T, partial [Armatimonadota bacterium]|nr:glycine cleavage system protein T [Armatimonadota bacterium]